MRIFSTTTVVPGLMLCRFSSGLNYENAEIFLQMVLAAIREERPSPRLLILRCAFIDSVDYIAARMLAELSDRLRSEGVSLLLCECSPQVRKFLSECEALETIGLENVLTSIEAAMAAFSPEPMSSDGFALKP